MLTTPTTAVYPNNSPGAFGFGELENLSRNFELNGALLEWKLQDVFE